MKANLIILALTGVLASASAFAYDSDNQPSAADESLYVHIIAPAPRAPEHTTRLEAWDRMEATQRNVGIAASEPVPVPYLNDVNRECE
jgi:hypothetical protein